MAEDTKKEKKSKDSMEQKGEDSGKKKIRFGLRLKFSLAIIALVALVLFTLAFYFIQRESELLRKQIFTYIQRELIHISNSTRESIGVDELALLSAIQDLKKIEYIKYAYILNQKNQIVRHFNPDVKQLSGETIKDKVKRDFSKAKGADKILITIMKDKSNRGSLIIHFSRKVPHKFFKNKTIGTVIIGITNSIIRKEIAEATKVIILISLVFLAISMLGAFVLASITIKPIRVLSNGAAIIGKGNLDHQIEIKSSDELGQLANEFNDMTAMIKNAKEKEIETRIMDEQLEIAKDIQEGLNPMYYYDKKGIQIKGYTRAAKGVGGDYYDYLDIDENRVCALISDVSGKGVPASLVMVMIRTVFTTYVSRKDLDCAKVVKAINDSLSADFAIDKFATLFFIIYDREKEELSFSNAGHGPLYCYRADKASCSAAKLDGVPIGIMEDVDYQQAKVKLGPGDMVMMCTDGITEMRNMKREEYGLGKVLELMINNHDMNANDFVDLLVNDVDEFRGEAQPHDDMTTLIFKRVE